MRFWRRVQSMFLLACLAMSCCGRSMDDVSVEVLSSEFIYESASFPSCHASTVLETEDGLLAAWFGGSYESHPDVSIYCSRYDGSAWSEPALIADGIRSDSLRYPCWNPVLYRLQNGKVALFYKVGPNPREWWGEYKLSTDDGKSWGEKTLLPEGFLGPIKNKPVASTGKVLNPSSVEFTPDHWEVHIESSAADLSRWERIDVDNNGFNAIQPTVFLHKGRLEMLCRTQEGVIAKSTSRNRGKTWTPLEATSLENNNSGIDGVVAAGGLRLLVCNPLRQGRNKLALLGSYDGESWRTLLTLEDHPEGEFSYPAIILRKDGTADITYTFNREKIKHVHLKVVCRESVSKFNK